MNHNLKFNSRKFEYLRRTGNREEVENCQNADQNLIQLLERCPGLQSHKKWKGKVTATL